MRVLVYADQQAHEWRDMLRASGHTVAVLPCGVPPTTLDWDVCLVLNGDASEVLSYRFWLAQITMPTLLVTTALAPAQALCRHVPWLRLVCHPNRAVQYLSDLLHMTCDVRAGAMVLGPILTPRFAHSSGSAYAIS